MTRTIKLTVAAIIFGAVLSLTTFAQGSPWIRMMNQGISNVNDVAMHPNGRIWITKTDGTIWSAQNENSNFVQVPAPGFAVRISANVLTCITTNDGRLFYRHESANTWQQINRPNSFVNDVDIGFPHTTVSGTYLAHLWISETIFPIASNNSVKYINAKNDVSEKTLPPQIGVVSYLDYYALQGTFNGSFTSTNSMGFSRVSVKAAGLQNQVWGVGFNGTVWKYVGNSWIRTPAQGMSDVTDAHGGNIWLAGQQQYNGTIWCSTDIGLTFRQDTGAQGFQNLASSYGWSEFQSIYAAGYNGTLWKRAEAPSPCIP